MAALNKIEVNKLPIDRLEAVPRVKIKDLEKRKDKAMKRFKGLSSARIPMFGVTKN